VLARRPDSPISREGHSVFRLPVDRRSEVSILLVPQKEALDQATKQAGDATGLPVAQ